MKYNLYMYFSATDCSDIISQGHSTGDGMYWIVPDGGSHSNAFLAYCDMTSYNGGWTMCYTTDEYAKPRTEFEYNALFPYETDGYRTNCNNIEVSKLHLFMGKKNWKDGVSLRLFFYFKVTFFQLIENVKRQCSGKRKNVLISHITASSIFLFFSPQIPFVVFEFLDSSFRRRHDFFFQNRYESPFPSN